MSGETLNATLPAGGLYDEMFDAAGRCRPQYEAHSRRLDEIPNEELRRRQ